jgi:hypothetical protein
MHSLSVTLYAKTVPSIGACLTKYHDILMPLPEVTKSKEDQVHSLGSSRPTSASLSSTSKAIPLASATSTQAIKEPQSNFMVDASEWLFIWNGKDVVSYLLTR